MHTENLKLWKKEG